MSGTVLLHGWKPWEEADFYADRYSDEVVAFLSSSLLSSCSSDINDSFAEFLYLKSCLCRLLNENAVSPSIITALRYLIYQRVIWEISITQIFSLQCS